METDNKGNLRWFLVTDHGITIVNDIKAQYHKDVGDAIFEDRTDAMYFAIMAMSSRIKDLESQLEKKK